MGKAPVISALNNVMSHRKYSFTVNSVNLLQYFPVHATAFTVRTRSVAIRIIFSCTYLFGLNYIILYHTRENGENAFKVFWGWWFNHSFRYKDRNVCVCLGELVGLYVICSVHIYLAYTQVLWPKRCATTPIWGSVSITTQHPPRMRIETIPMPWAILLVNLLCRSVRCVSLSALVRLSGMIWKQICIDI